MKILFVITEAEPFIKTGGLGVVGGSLPFALQEQGVEIRVIIPRYRAINPLLLQEVKDCATFSVPLAWRNQVCTLQELTYNGIHYYFLDNPYYFDRSQCYGEEDEGEQYAFFCRGVLESIRYMGEFKPDILHCHDWHSALIPVFWEAFYAQDTLYHKMKTLFTIHNLKYQGIFPGEVLFDVLGLDWDYYTPEKLEFRGGVNYMKGGILYSDLLTTVSPTYAKEIQYPYFGEELDGVIRQRKDTLIGILNGIPPREHLFSLEDKLEGKVGLQKKLGLNVGTDIPLLSMVSRLVEQKGLDLLLHVMDEIMALDIQLIIMGRGDQVYENKLKDFSALYGEKMKVVLTYEEELAHFIYLGSDMFLMPSRFEPCGIAQMMAMSYGTIPIVRETGGLKDTVISYDWDQEKGNGFSHINYNAHEFLTTVQKAVGLYKVDKDTWRKLQENAQSADFTWKNSASQYIKLYEDLYYEQSV